MTTEQRTILLQLITTGTQTLGLSAFEKDNATKISEAIEAFKAITIDEEKEDNTNEI
tara:strand:+ start:9245 stop:9415 length:171 start_codon:yes stop_codon:yes gene_type:complete